MSIQQSINQALGISALLASQSPMAAAHKEKVFKSSCRKEWREILRYSERSFRRST